MIPTDHELQTLFRTSTADLEPEVESLVAGGIARGRRQRRRRTAGSALAAIAVIGVIGIAASVVPGLGDHARTSPDGQVAADPSPSKSPSPSSPAPTDVGTRDLAVRANQIPALVTAVAPGDVSPAPQSTGGYIDGGKAVQVAHFLWNGYLTSVGAMKGETNARTACRNLEDGATCTERPDGSTVLSWHQTGPERDGSVTGQGVHLFTPDGWEVYAISYNAGEGKDAPVLSAEPPIAAAQLEQIVTSDVWFE